MHIVIDILAGIILLFFFLSGWHKGTLLAALGGVRMIVSVGTALLSGRFIGAWLGEISHRPRIITIPVVALFTFSIILFLFKILMHNILEQHKEKEKKENFQHPIPSCLIGGTINLAIGTFALAILFWIGDLFFVGMAGRPLPGAEQSNFGQFARRMVYEIAYANIPTHQNEAQVAALARMISNPADGVTHLKNVLAADSIQQLLKDEEFGQVLLSGDADSIAQNDSLQQLFNDRTTLDELRDLGFLSGKESKTGLCKKLSAVGKNETIRSSIENLQAKQLLRTDKILLLIRDPDFDQIVAELMQ